MAPSWKSIETSNSAPRKEAFACLAVASTAAMPTESAVLAPAAAMLAEPAMLSYPAVLAELVMLKTAAPVAVIKIEQTIARIVGVSAVGVSAVDVTLTLCRASGARC
jgi:hypothetical protein